MSCASCSEELDGLARSALPVVSDALAGHLDECVSCREVFDRGRVVLEPFVFEHLDADRRARLVTELARARLGRRPRRAAVVAAAIVIAVVSGWTAWRLLSPDGVPAQEVLAALVDDHVHYLDQPERHEGGERAALEAEMALHVGFPVSLPAPARSHLTGGRRCYLLDRRVALAFYDTPAGSASYFVLPTQGLELPEDSCDAPEPLRCAMHRGLVVVAWTKGGLLHALTGQRRDVLLAMADDLSQADKIQERP